MQKPNYMRCVYKESKEAKPYITEIPIPAVEEGQLLIKVDYTPINPSDIKFLQGKSSSGKPFPCVPGFEGAGTVVLTGGGMSSWGMSGKRVAFHTNHQFGTYGEYCVADTNLCIELDNEIQTEDASCSFVNPLTVIGMLDICKKNNSKAVIHNPGASQVGRMMNRYFRENNVQVINIVRREDQFNELRYNGGVELIIDQNEPDFLQKLKVMCTATQANIYFDAVGGDQSGQILNIMPKGSKLIMYGTLASWQIGSVKPNDLLKEQKSLEGFFLHIWLAQLNKIELMLILKKLKTLIKTALKTKIAKQFSLDQFQEAVDYYQTHMTEGKVLISPKKTVLSISPTEKQVEQKVEQVKEQEKEQQVENTVEKTNQNDVQQHIANTQDVQKEEIPKLQNQGEQQPQQEISNNENQVFEEDEDSSNSGFGEGLNDVLSESEQK